MWSWRFWRAALERALSTAAQSLLGGVVVGSSVVDVPWLAILSIAATATVVSLLKSVVVGVGSEDGSPSLGGGEKLHGGE